MNSNLNDDIELKKELHGIIMRANAFALNNDPELVAQLVAEGFWQECDAERIYDTAKQMLDSDLPELSEKFTQLFKRFNNEYFDGRVPEYTVTVRYVLRRNSQSCYCEADHAIQLRAGSEPHMVTRLISTMAQIVSAYDEEALEKEMERLREVDSPTWTHPDMKAISAEDFIEEFKQSVIRVGNGCLWQASPRILPDGRKAYN